MPRKKPTLQQQIDAAPEEERAAAVAETLHDLANKIVSGEKSRCSNAT